MHGSGPRSPTFEMPVSRLKERRGVPTDRRLADYLPRRLSIAPSSSGVAAGCHVRFPVGTTRVLVNPRRSDEDHQRH
jgi:hypothetical protein